MLTNIQQEKIDQMFAKCGEVFDAELYNRCDTCVPDFKWFSQNRLVSYFHMLRAKTIIIPKA